MEDDDDVYSDVGSGDDSFQGSDSDGDFEVPAPAADRRSGGNRRRARSESEEGSDSSSSSSESEGQIEYAEDSDAGGDATDAVGAADAGVDDLELARQLDREMNGLRGRPKRTSAYNVSAPEPSGRGRSQAKRRKTHGSGGGGLRLKVKLKGATRTAGRRRAANASSGSESEEDEYYIPVHSRPTRSNDFTRGKKRVNYKENDENDEDLYEDDEIDTLRWSNAAGTAEKSVKRIPALAPCSEALEDQDYDIERVIDHRWEQNDDDDDGGGQGGGGEAKTLKLWVKWQRRAYIYSTWEYEEDLQLLTGYKRVTNYMRKVRDLQEKRTVLSPEEQEQLDVEKEMELQLVSQHMEIDRIVEEEDCGDLGTCYLIKWNGLPYSECTWEPAETIQRCHANAHLDTFQAYQQRGREAGSAIEAQRTGLMGKLRRQGGKLFSAQPGYVTGGTLRAYQLDGLNYLAACWARNSNCILADEMGLGKTIQCVTMLNFLFEEVNLTGPFLVVVPLSTLPNWKKEFGIWAPSLNTVVYVGDGQSREVIRTYEVYNSGGKGRRFKMNVLLTTYEVVLKDSTFMKSIQWAYLMVDEAHRLKNNESSLYRELSGFHCKTRLLVTGTPLQNNVKELWALLRFLPQGVLVL